MELVIIESWPESQVMMGCKHTEFFLFGTNEGRADSAYICTNKDINGNPYCKCLNGDLSDNPETEDDET